MPQLLLSKIYHMRYTFDMAIIDDIYKNVDDFGLITSSEAKAFGVSNIALVHQARRGKLVRVGRGVYRVALWPYQEEAPYAIAVKAAGENTYLYGESVLALLGLAPTDPRRIWIASPDRVRRNLGEGVVVMGRQAEEPTILYEGVPCQHVANAIKAAVSTIGKARARQAAAAALEAGYITEVAKNLIMEELA